MSIVLEARSGGDGKPHPEGIFAAVCVDVLDLGMVENVYQGEVRIVPMVRLIWETDAPPQEGGRVGRSLRRVARRAGASSHAPGGRRLPARGWQAGPP